MKASENNGLTFPGVIRGLRAGPESGSGWEPKEAGNSDESGQVESGGAGRHSQGHRLASMTGGGRSRAAFTPSGF